MRGHNPDWANLPRRKCDDCGTNYKPKQPIHKTDKDGKPIEQRGFCSDNCRKSYHKHGGAYRKLKVEMKRMVEKELQKIRSEMEGMVTQEFKTIREDVRRLLEGQYASYPTPSQKDPAQHPGALRSCHD